MLVFSIRNRSLPVLKMRSCIIYMFYLRDWTSHSRSACHLCFSNFSVRKHDYGSLAINWMSKIISIKLLNHKVHALDSALLRFWPRTGTNTLYVDQPLLLVVFRDSGCLKWDLKVQLPHQHESTESTHAERKRWKSKALALFARVYQDLSGWRMWCFFPGDLRWNVCKVFG